MDVRASGLGLSFVRGGRAPRVCFKCGTDKYVEHYTIDFVADGQRDSIDGVPLCGPCHQAHQEAGSASPARPGRAFFVAGFFAFLLGRILSLAGLVLVVEVVVDVIGILLFVAGLVVRFGGSRTLSGTESSPDRLNVVDGGTREVVFEVRPEVAKAVVDRAKQDEASGARA